MKHWMLSLTLLCSVFSSGTNAALINQATSISYLGPAEETATGQMVVDSETGVIHSWTMQSESYSFELISQTTDWSLTPDPVTPRFEANGLFSLSDASSTREIRFWLYYDWSTDYQGEATLETWASVIGRGFF